MDDKSCRNNSGSIKQTETIRGEERIVYDRFYTRRSLALKVRQVRCK